MSPASFLRFLLTLRIAAIAFAGLDVAVALAWRVHSLSLLIVAAGTFAVAIGAWGGRALVLRGRLDRGAQLVGVVLLIVAGTLSPVAVYATSTLVLIPIVAVSMVLPYVRGSALRVFFICAFLTMLWVVASAGWLDHLSQPPRRIALALNVLGSCTVACLALLSLWQFSERLRATLDDEVKSVQARDEFMSIASHELRTPLTSMQLSLYSLLRSSGDTHERFGRSLALVVPQVTRLTLLVGEMLTSGRIGMGRAEQRPHHRARPAALHAQKSTAGPVSLVRLLLALRVTAAAFALLFGVVAWRARSVSLAALAATVLLFAIGCWVASALAVRGRVELCAKMAGYLVLAVSAVLALLAPWAPTIVLVPFLGVAIVLPIVRGASLRVFSVCTLATVLWVVVSAALLIDETPLDLPHARVLLLVGAGTATFLALLPLWQFSERMRAVLDESTKAVRVRDAFLSMAAEELRAPLALLRRSVASLHGESGDIPLPSQLERPLALVDRQVTKLLRLVNEMLDIGRIQTGGMELVLDDVDLGRVVSEVTERMAADLKNVGSPLALRQEPVWGRFDREKLDHVVMNLLANAIKFGEGKPIEIVVEPADDERVARLVIVDHGIGIQRADVPRLFQRFERAVSSRCYGGLGLGLFIARAIVEAHGGRIGVVSEGAETGARFVVELPRRAQATST